MDALRDLVQEGGARLVIIDPFFAYLSPGLSPNNDPDVRRALTPLSRLAEDTDCAIVLIHHPNKAEGMSALHRISGSVGISAALRMALLVAKDPDTDTRRVLASLKSNLGAPAPSITFSFETGSNPAVAHIDWHGPSPHSAESLLAGGYRAGLIKGDQAIDFLKATLADGPIKAVDLEQKRGAAGIAGRTFERARLELGVVSKPSCFGGERYVMLPEHIESFEGRDRDGSLYPEELAETGQARPPDPRGEATSPVFATMAETGSPPKEIGSSVRHSVRHVGEDWENGLVEGDSRPSSSSVRHLLGKAGSLEENGSGDLFEGFDITPQANPAETTERVPCLEEGCANPAVREGRCGGCWLTWNKAIREETAGGAT